jgi:hypothetical protein
MLTFPRIELANNIIFMRELRLGEAIQIARMPNLIEVRLTAFLGFVLNDKHLPLALSVQERYYLLMMYQTCQKNTDLALSGNYAPYFLIPSQREAWQTQITDHEFVVTHLTGHQVEVLEELCEDMADWMLCSIAMQSQAIPSISDWPTLPDSPTKSDLSTILRQRIAKLEALPDSTFDELYGHFLYLTDRLARYVKFSFDDIGVVILGGTDDAPVRFRATTCLGRFSKLMEQHLAQKSQEPSPSL